jgi:hypothetical protein
VRRILFYLMWVCLVAVVFPMTASSTIVKPFALSTMTTESQSIIRGVVVDQETLFDAEWGHVYTHTFVQVQEVLAGSQAPGAIVVVRQLGGELDGIETHVVGNAAFALESEVLIFARTDGAFHYLVGMSQGAYSVEDDGFGVGRLSRNTAGLHYAWPLDVPRGKAVERARLDTLRQWVMEILEEEGRP